MPDPSISIVVPVYEDPVGVRETLESLLTATDETAQIVVVDNGSTDRTPAVVEGFADECARVDLVFEREIQSSYAARNRGIRAATSETLAFVDADVTVAEGWLEDVNAALERTGAPYLGCRVELEAPEEPSLAARFDHHTGFPVQSYLETQRFAPTCCLVVRREVFADVGLFDPRLVSGGDKEFGNRVHEAGYDLAYAGEATLFHPVRDSIGALVRKDLRVGRGHCQLQRCHPERYGRPGIPPRPSGVKRPQPDLQARDRAAFGVLSGALTAVRGVGYYREYVAGTRGALSTDTIPPLE